ncbi:MAG: YeeE/YedE thiosulfate transporter family protein, partial [Hyphomicrobiales bacterium]
MSTATVSVPASSAAPQIDYLFLGAAVAATAILVALVLLDGQPASAALILGGFALGIAFLKAEFSYTASWRRFLTRGEAGGLIGGLIVIAICALAIVPVAALLPGFGGAIAPLGPSLVVGAFVFGIGMQLANGCGSGTL